MDKKVLLYSGAAFLLGTIIFGGLIPLMRSQGADPEVPSLVLNTDAKGGFAEWVRTDVALLNQWIEKAVAKFQHLQLVDKETGAKLADLERRVVALEQGLPPGGGGGQPPTECKDFEDLARQLIIEARKLNEFNDAEVDGVFDGVDYLKYTSEFKALESEYISLKDRMPIPWPVCPLPEFPQILRAQ